MAPRPITRNTLFYGDNLPILREYIPDECVDLVYLDPPFNSNRSYNVLFKDESGKEADAQIEAFYDSWHWDRSAEETYHHLVTEYPENIASMIGALRQFIGSNQMMAYLVMMAARLVELHRVLKPTGSLYLHCDPTASHYLKIILDGIFGFSSYLNEISWKRSSAHSDTKQGMQRCGRIRDVILVYAKTSDYIWNALYTPYSQDYLEAEYRHISSDGRYYKETDLTAAKPGGDTEYDWPVKRPVGKNFRWQADLDEEFADPKPGWEYRAVRPYSGRFWAYSKQNMIEFAHANKLIYRETGMPRLMHFADEMPGIPLQDLWTDIAPALGAQNLGYPTQKPLSLLERIVQMGSNPGDIILDPFCGCGTAIVAAQNLERRWIGIDVTHLSIALMKYRLKDINNLDEGKDYQVVGEPEDIGAARQLAQDDRYQFQWWALSLIRARPLGGDSGSKKGKKGSDRGIDGVINFIDDQSGKPKRALIQVKSGHVKSGDMRDLVGTVQ
ncbi:MAG: site-specific DNA-methyltransferase, partial [Candidatus Methanoperedens sp.]|nr:site-specific DNA-methyltransferase [Candidatus Methanoperedens sp.]